MHQLDLIIDMQYGSTGKGLIAGYLAKRNQYDTAVCSFAPNAGHRYIDRENEIHVMTQQIPTGGLISPSVKRIMIGPGSAIHAKTLVRELHDYAPLLAGKELMIHPHAAVVEDYHSEEEMEWGMTRMGSTAKGVGASYIERIKRDTVRPNIVGARWHDDLTLSQLVVTAKQYREALEESESILVEGAQGFSLSMYHGQYPYTTSRDVTPWQIMADCGLPFKWANQTQVIGTLRTFPIRVNNRDGTSGPCYPDQEEVKWDDLGLTPELTTVTKLPRRIFTFSHEQLREALFHCGGYWNTKLFLNFANYFNDDHEKVMKLVDDIETPKHLALNPPQVAWLGYGPDDSDIVTRENWLME